MWISFPTLLPGVWEHDNISGIYRLQRMAVQSQLMMNIYK